jgi:O-antigen/teichoic acid export membrane protein
MLWQLLGKFFQVVGMVYATRCLGPDYIGVSRTVITLAMTLQLCIAFGLDAVAVRHVTKGIAKVKMAEAISLTLAIPFVTCRTATASSPNAIHN